jgi:hypothetical protein
MSDDPFDAARERKWLFGRAERGLEEDDPFEGNPLSELLQEFEDSANYLEEALRQKLITGEEARYGISRARESWLWAVNRLETPANP